MLRSLQISHYVLIDSLEIIFPEGLVIITGQTGAGKSILLGALSLLSGAKADASLISEGADSCVVEAEFSVPPGGSLAEMLDDAGVEPSSDGSLTVRRVLARSGRSRCFVNDCPVPVVVLQGISSRLIDIHSQHRSLLVTDPSFRLDILDRYAGNSELLERCGSLWRDLTALRRSIAEIRARLGRLESERDYNTAQWKQLDAASLRVGELEELEEEQRGLANAGQIKEGLQGAMEILSPRDDDRGGVSSALRDAVRGLEKIARYLSSVSDLAGRLESARIEIADIYSGLEEIDSSVDLSPERLDQVEGRMSLLYSLLKKHNCTDVDELIAVRDTFSETLSDSSAMEDRLAEDEKEEARLAGEYRSVCVQLSESRRKAAGRFASCIEESLHFLELDRAVFEVRLEDAPASADGCDRADFLFSSTGSVPVDVARCASGGEISRIMLCLKAMMAKFIGMPTLIFDEIDTGVSGSVADRMGRMICDMGRDMQVFSITHLPQVAAKGDAHYLVSKSVDASGKTVSGISRLDGRQRVLEIARMLSGSEVTDAAIANAVALLGESR